MTSASENALAVSATYEAETFARAIADGCSEAFAHAYAAAAAAAYLETYLAAFTEGLTVGINIGREAERKRLRSLRTKHAAHGAEAQRWLMARELGLIDDIVSSPLEDVADPPSYAH